MLVSPSVTIQNGATWLRAYVAPFPVAHESIAIPLPLVLTAIAGMAPVLPLSGYGAQPGYIGVPRKRPLTNLCTAKMPAAW